MIAPSIGWLSVVPELALAAGLLMVIVVDLVVSDRKRSLVAALATLATLAAGASAVAAAVSGWHAQMFTGAYVVDDFSLTAKALVAFATAGVLLLGTPRRWKGEYCTLMVSSVLGMTLLVSARDFLLFFVAFELMALPGYLLTGWRKKERAGAEAALKYYLLGALASGVMLYGISFLYGLSGGTSFAGVATLTPNTVLLRVAVLLVVVGMVFKVSAVPLHFWAPDAYQGAPPPVAGFLGVASKAAGFFALLVVVHTALPEARSIWAPLLFGLAIATMVIGSLIALKQVDLMRLLAYSAVAQSGYLLIPLAISHGSAVETRTIASTTEYLVIYAVSGLVAFGAASIIIGRARSSSLDALRGLFYRSPFAGVALSVALLSLAGIPPLGGWFAKLVIIRDAIAANTVPGVIIAAVAAVTTAIGLVYYLSVIRRLWLEPEPRSTDAETVETPASATVVVALLGAALVLVGIVPVVVIDIGGFPSLQK